MSLNGRIAIIAGGTKDVGRGNAADLARQGVHVFVTGRSAPDHKSIGERTTAIRCDHCIDSEVEGAFKFIRSEVEAIDKFTWSRPFWEQLLWRWDVWGLDAQESRGVGYMTVLDGQLLNMFDLESARCQETRKGKSVGRIR